MDLVVNRRRHSVNPIEGATLLDVLREDLHLTGAKYGCGEAQCGACTVLVDGQPVQTCVTPAEAAAGKNVLTVEGLERDGQLDPLQQAFLAENAFQCGYCTPGMLLAARSLLARDRAPSEAAIRRELDGHICRCGTYGRIVRAIQRAAQENPRG